MNRIKDYGKLATDISTWIKNYAESNNIKSLVVGVSGGIDSAVVSTLCAMSGLETICVMLPIHQEMENSAAENHILQLSSIYPLTTGTSRDISPVFDTMKKIMEFKFENQEASVNTKARLRMTALYHIAKAWDGIVVGTGNKVEDFGVGFYTKYGDGGVDISPIADLYKTEVRELGRYLGISEEILNAAPTDGLWADGRTDEQQIGATYEELEWVMEVPCKEFVGSHRKYTPRQIEVIRIYEKLHGQNQHKMQPIPIYKLPL